MNKGFIPKLNACKDKNGRILGEENKIIERWTQHYQEKLNPQAEIQTERIQYLTAEIELKPPDILDTEIAIQKLKNNRTPGEDSITAELIKKGGPKLIEVFHKLITSIWEKEVMPKEWNNGLIFSIFKKGDKLECDNYRGITLLNIAYKVLSNIIMNRINFFAEEILEECQCGFRCGRGTTEQIFIIRQLMEKCFEFNTELHFLFVDFKQAFDSINRIELINAIESFGIPKKLVRLVNMAMENNKAKVIMDGNVGKDFDVKQGVRQGDGLSAVLFNLALDKVIKELKLKGNILYKSKQACVYADDIALIARNVASLQEMLVTIKEIGMKYGLNINEAKTKYMKMEPKLGNIRQTTNIKLDEYTFERVTNFKYLGVIVNNKADIKQEISNRILMANRAYFTNNKLLKSKLISRSTKIQIYKTLIRPVATYAAETWTLNISDENTLRIFERRIIRKIYGPICENGLWRVRHNLEINDLLQGKDIVRHIKSLRLSWLGHLERMENERSPKNILNGEIIGVRRRGRPKKRWLQNVWDDINTMRVTGWREKARDRDIWRRIVKEAKAHKGL